jgi:hypothetical protein
VAESVTKECAISEAGQRILECLTGKLLFESPAISYITRMPSDRVNRRDCRQVVAGQFEGPPTPIGMLDTDVQRPDLP